MTNQNKMREQFEEECAEWEMDTSRDSEGDYVDRQARRGWNLWQAATAYAGAATPKAAQGDAIPREDFAWLVVQEACETDPADEDDPECIRILRRDLKSAVLAAFLRYDAENHGIAWDAYQAGHAAAKAAVAAERERAATVVDEKIGAVHKANPGSDGGINSAVGFVLYALGSCADAIRAGAPPDTLREAGAVAGGAA